MDTESIIIKRVTMKIVGKNEVCTIIGDNTPTCACKPGFVKVEKFGCVDESPPILKLRNDPHGTGITRLKQGDIYKEHAVDVIDENAEDYLRSLKIAYSRPLPPGCLAEIGSFQVNYTVAMPWANPPYVRVTRNVIIEDIDECKLNVERYETQCPQLIPQCDTKAGAVCENTNGSYTCKCPKYTSGDGFKFMSAVQVKGDKFIGAPIGYNGGTGCRDTSKPVIQLLGPNPKVFRTCKVGGLHGMMKSAKHIDKKSEKLIGDQRSGYEEDIVRMIKETSAAELCATYSRKKPRPVDCVKATDHTYKGDEDISEKVSVGNIVKVSDLEWKVPYNVMDDAGNTADVVWRRIVVEEVDLNDIETKIRADILKDRDRELNEAVRVAVEKEKKKLSASSNTKPRLDESQKCPTCPLCDCPNNGLSLSLAECDRICEKKMNQQSKTCPTRGERTAGRTLLHSLLDYFVDLTEGILNPNFAGILLVSFLFVFFVFIINRIVEVNEGGWQYFDAQDEQRERELLNQVTYFNGRGRDEMRSPSFTPSTAERGSNISGGPAPPRHSLSASAGIFSPPPDQFTSPTGGSSIYQNGRNGFQSPMSPIMPGSAASNQQSASRDNAAPYNLRKRY